MDGAKGKTIVEAELTKTVQNQYLEGKTPKMDFRVNEKTYRIVDKEIIICEYAPDAFAHLRKLDGFDNEDLKKSLDPNLDANVKNIFKAGEGMGKSASFFFFSHDTRFLIKTMTDNDFNAFMKLFQLYFEHINNYKNSLIARIYGVYSVEMEQQDKQFLILMGNTKQIDDKFIKKIYDLKGSMVKREVKGEEKSFKHTACLKDKNILNVCKHESFINFCSHDIKKIMNRIRLDATLLSHFNLMDYSMLFVACYNPNYVEMYPE